MCVRVCASSFASACQACAGAYEWLRVTGTRKHAQIRGMRRHSAMQDRHTTRDTLQGEVPGLVCALVMRETPRLVNTHMNNIHIHIHIHMENEREKEAILLSNGIDTEKQKCIYRAISMGGMYVCT